jgi:hypothetical protein
MDLIFVWQSACNICSPLHQSVYKGASKDHVITNVAGGKTITLKKQNFPDTGKEKQ